MLESISQFDCTEGLFTQYYSVSTQLIYTEGCNLVQYCLILLLYYIICWMLWLFAAMVRIMLFM